MSKPTNYCTIEFTFLTGGENQTFMMLTSAQRYAYICAWSYAVSLRRLHLSCYEMEDRLGAIYDIDRRTVAKMLQRCCDDSELMIKENGGYLIIGVDSKHGKLKNFKDKSKPTKNNSTGDSIGQYNIVEDSNIKTKDANREADLVIDRLNKKTSSNYRHKEASRKPIRARLKEYSLDDCWNVIDYKVAEWTGTEMEKYLQPSTLFNGKFDERLNAATKWIKSGRRIISNGNKPEHIPYDTKGLN